MEPTPETLQLLIQGGAVGITLAIIIYSAWKDKIYNKTLNNHLQHTHESDMMLSKNLLNLTGVIERNNESHQHFRGSLDTAARLNGEMMRFIESGILNRKNARRREDARTKRGKRGAPAYMG